MKYRVVFLNSFKRDLKIIKRRGYDLKLLSVIIDTLQSGEKLSVKHRDHNLLGSYKGSRECHITPDWLLIYRITESKLFLLLSRTGTHSDLF